MSRKLALLGLLAVAGVAAYFFEPPLDWGMSPEEVARSLKNGRRIFATQCVVCHSEDPERPTPAELRSDYSERQLGRALRDPPPGMPPFFGSEDERRDLLLYLTQG